MCIRSSSCRSVLIYSWFAIYCAVAWHAAAQDRLETTTTKKSEEKAATPASPAIAAQSKYTPEQQKRIDEATQLDQQVVQLFRQGKYDEAAKLCDKALAIHKELVGENHPDYATSLNNRAALYESQGNYAASLPLKQQALTIYEKALGPNDPDVAMALNNLATLYQTEGNFDEALPLYRRALKINESALGPDHPNVAGGLNNLATLYKAQGNYTDALPLYQRALKINESIYGPDHRVVAVGLSNLATLYYAEGDYTTALPYFQRALKISEATVGTDHPTFAASLNNLAMLYEAQGKYDDALPLYQHALKIREKVYGPDHPYVAQSLNSLAGLYKEQRNYADALPQYQRALAIFEKALGPNNPYTATSLNNIAQLHQEMGNYQQALPLFQRALKIDEQVFGPNHPDVATDINNLAMLYSSMGDDAKAEPLAHKVLEISRQQLELTATVQSERQQLQMAEWMRGYLDNYLTVAHGAGISPEKVYAEVLAWKGSVSARQRAMRQFRRAQQDPNTADLYRTLAATARKLDSLSRAMPAPEQASEYQKMLAELNQSLETEQQELARASADYQRHLAEKKRTPADLLQALPADCVLIDLLEYSHFQPREKKGLTWQRRLAAFVVRNKQPIEWIELGPAEPIRAAVDNWRQSYSPAAGAELRRLLWRPLEDKIVGATTVLVSPDGALDRFPLAALPGKNSGTYLIEDVAIATVPIPRLLPELLSDVSSAPAASPSLLTVGEVDFKATLLPATDANLLAQSAPVERTGAPWQFEPLDGTRAEIVAINDSFEQRFPDAQHKSLRKAQATKQAVCEAMPHYEYLHLATHGFFAPPEFRCAIASAEGKPATSPADTRSAELDVIGYHPDLLVGLALAGANQKAELGQEDGILTALAVEELDLSNVQLATLSACETGLGRTAGGEGVLGLQRAFQLAGARSTVTTLWKIPDKASQLLMTDFYDNLWNQEKRLPKLEALRKAQLKMLREGANRGLEIAGQSAGAEHRMPPYYWAAFELSGDWR